MRDELWFIEFGRGVQLPLTPEETPADGEPVVPCAQGRVIVERTGCPVLPHFATCSTYRRVHATSVKVSATHAAAKPPTSEGNHQELDSAVVNGRLLRTATTVQSPATRRPEELGVRPWYLEQDSIDVSPAADRSSYPSCSFGHEREATVDLASTRNSSLEADNNPSSNKGCLPRKACMDLKDAIAMLDETCPNQDLSPALTPRTPLTPYPRNKRARSKSSDNSSNYSNDRFSDKSVEKDKQQEKEKKRPFLRKIGISMTEDRPLLAILAPRIIGKPYLQKIGPSKAVDKPFLDKIGSSKTLDKFIFDYGKHDRKKAMHSKSSQKSAVSADEMNLASPQPAAASTPTETKFASRETRRSGKGFLLKMYSFDMEDIDEPIKLKGSSDDVQATASLDNTRTDLPRPESLAKPSYGERCEARKSTFANQVPALVKCKVTTSAELIASTTCLDDYRGDFSPSKTRKQASDDTLDKIDSKRKEDKHYGDSSAAFVSSDNLRYKQIVHKESYAEYKRRTNPQRYLVTSRIIYPSTSVRSLTSSIVVADVKSDGKVPVELSASKEIIPNNSSIFG